jgi:hypothetical protein
MLPTGMGAGRALLLVASFLPAVDCVTDKTAAQLPVRFMHAPQGLRAVSIIGHEAASIAKFPDFRKVAD